MAYNEKRRRGKMCPVVSPLDTGLPLINPTASLVASSQEERNKRTRHLTKNEPSQSMTDTNTHTSKQAGSELGKDGAGLAKTSKRKRRTKRHAEMDPAVLRIDNSNVTSAVSQAAANLPPLPHKDKPTESAEVETVPTLEEPRKLKVRHTKKTSQAKTKVKNGSGTDIKKSDKPAIVVSHTIVDDTKPKKLRVRHTKKSAQVLSNTSMAKSANSDILVITHDTPVSSIASTPSPRATPSPGLNTSSVKGGTQYKSVESWYCNDYKSSTESDRLSTNLSSTRMSQSSKSSPTRKCSADCSAVFSTYTSKSPGRSSPSECSMKGSATEIQGSAFRFRAKPTQYDSPSPGHDSIVDECTKPKATGARLNVSGEFKFHAPDIATATAFKSSKRNGQDRDTKLPLLPPLRPTTPFLTQTGRVSSASTVSSSANTCSTHLSGKSPLSQSRSVSMSPQTVVSTRCSTASPGSGRCRSPATIMSACSSARSSNSSARWN